MEITTLGIDLAKNVFRVHGVDAHGKMILQRPLKRRQVLAFMSQLQPCLVGMESCGGAHYWAREIGKLGHRVKLISPRFVRPYVKSNKNDARDAEAICEAVSVYQEHWSQLRGPAPYTYRFLQTDFRLPLKVGKRRSVVLYLAV